MGFGNLTGVCKIATVPMCNLIYSGDDHFKTGIVTKCYSRSIYLANTVIFQMGNTIINIGALVLVILIVFNIGKKFTAIGRSEMMFFYFNYFMLTAFSIVVDCGVAPPGSKTYLYLVAVQNGFISSSCWSLMLCGLLGFEFWEDGKKKSMLMVQGSSLLFFIISFVITVATFNNVSDSMNFKNTLGVFVVVYLLNAIWIFVFVVSQVFLCFYVLKNYWGLGTIMLCVFFLVVSQILIYVLSQAICEGCNHYIDGLFFGTLSNTFAIMMVYKYWDIITAEDLEFSVSSEAGAVKYMGVTQESPTKGL